MEKSTNRMSINIIIADSQPVVRAGLYSFFNESCIRILDESVMGATLPQKVMLYHPDLVLMDSIFPDEDGLVTVENLRKENYRGRIVFFTTEAKSASLVRARALGVDAWFLKKTKRTELIRSLQFVMEGKNPDFTGELRRISRIECFHGKKNATDLLTPRERQVLQYIAHGLSNKEIAFSLGLAQNTIKEYVQNVLRKLEVRDRTEAAVWAVQNKF